MFERMGVVSAPPTWEREGKAQGGSHSFARSVAGMHPDPEDVKREEEVREKATRNPLKLQELIEQERARGAAEGGREAASQRLYEFQFAQSGWQSIRPSVGRGSLAGSVHGTGAADLGRLAAAGRSKRGLKRRKTT